LLSLRRSLRRSLGRPGKLDFSAEIFWGAPRLVLVGAPLPRRAAVRQRRRHRHWEPVRSLFPAATLPARYKSFTAASIGNGWVGCDIPCAEFCRRRELTTINFLRTLAQPVNSAKNRQLICVEIAVVINPYGACQKP
jgi:hypothetical protein